MMRPDEIALEVIMNASAAAFGVTYMRLVGGRDSSQPVVRARRLACWLARRMTTHSYPQIGRAMGRDHTTVIAAERAAEHQRTIDIEFAVISNTALSTLMTLERVGVLALAQRSDPVEVARRVLADPGRQALGLSLHDIVAMALAVAANAPTTTEQEADDGQDENVGR